jgi:hypothetical protein
MRKPLFIAVIAVSCVGIGYFAALVSRSETLSDFRSIQPGIIPGTNYEFVVEDSYFGAKNFFIQNSVRLTRNEVVRGPQNADLQYTILKQPGKVYLIVKRPSKLVGESSRSYFVWNITGDEPFFVGASMACQDPKLLRNHLEFQGDYPCTGPRQRSNDWSVMELR